MLFGPRYKKSTLSILGKRQLKWVQLPQSTTRFTALRFRPTRAPQYLFESSFGILIPLHKFRQTSEEMLNNFNQKRVRNVPKKSCMEQSICNVRATPLMVKIYPIILAPSSSGRGNQRFHIRTRWSANYQARLIKDISKPRTIFSLASWLDPNKTVNILHVKSSSGHLRQMRDPIQ